MDISHGSGCEHRAQEESGQFSTVGCTGQNSFREQIVLPVLLNIRTYNSVFVLRIHFPTIATNCCVPCDALFTLNLLIHFFPNNILF